MCPTQRSETESAAAAAAATRTVRSLLHRLGYRFRLQRADLAGCPDVVLPRWRLALFVAPCENHPHADCARAAGQQPPAGAGEEAQRLAQACATLERQGWQTLIVQACETDDPESLGRRLDIALQGNLIAAAGTARSAT